MGLQLHITYRLVLFLVWNLDWKWFRTRYQLAILIHSRHSLWTERKFHGRRFLMEFILHRIKLLLLLLNKEHIKIWTSMYDRIILYSSSPIWSITLWDVFYQILFTLFSLAQQTTNNKQQTTIITLITIPHYFLSLSIGFLWI